jgi:hypothetical protein
LGPRAHPVESPNDERVARVQSLQATVEPKSIVRNRFRKSAKPVAHRPVSRPSYLPVGRPSRPQPDSEATVAATADEQSRPSAGSPTSDRPAILIDNWAGTPERSYTKRRQADYATALACVARPSDTSQRAKTGAISTPPAFRPRNLPLGNAWLRHRSSFKSVACRKQSCFGERHARRVNAAISPLVGRPRLSRVGKCATYALFGCAPSVRCSSDLSVQEPVTY